MLIAVAGGCLGCAATWQPIRNDRIAEVVNRSQPDRARVVTAGAILEIRYPAVRADTLRGTVKADHDRKPVQVPLDSVDSLSLYRNRTGTAVVGVTMAVSFALLAFLLTNQSPPSKF